MNSQKSHQNGPFAAAHETVQGLVSFDNFLLSRLNKFAVQGRGDSGGGLFVKSGTVFYLKGLVSASLTNFGQCDVTNFALYTNVDKFMSWVKSPTEELGTVTQQQPSYNKPSYNEAPTKPLYSQSTTRPKVTTTQKPVSNCGLMSSGQGLIQGGSSTSRDQFPWTVAILVRQYYGNFVYFSTGTLISDRHIITTGLSVASLDPQTQQYIARSPKDFQMHFGISNLDQTSVQGSFSVDGAAQVILHPNIKHGFPRIANVGILVLGSSVQFNDYVSPACLPSSGFNYQESEGKNAFAVGWGQDDSGNDSKVKKFVSVKMRSENDCRHFWTDYSYERNKFFCAGGDGRRSACYRDQPLYVKSDNKWIIRGLISIAMNQPDNRCDLNKPVLYEDVGQFFQWIQSLLLNQRG